MDESRLELLKFRRDVGVITAADRAELDAALTAAEAEAKKGIRVICGEGATGCIVTSNFQHVPSTWDLTDGGNARAVQEWLAENENLTYPIFAEGFSLAAEAPVDLRDAKVQKT